ncbi:MAG: transcription termination/antitermination protein NusG [Pirellulaceae bacterium]|nr:transcription termination/antitermination protein NusG [Pirellulaceae bacterium]MDP7018500.1 transcription termination/antitermination protein NusG [Pirellulaceae bacterium]
MSVDPEKLEPTTSEDAPAPTEDAASTAGETQAASQDAVADSGPVADDAVADDAVAEEAAAEEPVADEPVVDEAAAEEPAVESVETSEPAADADVDVDDDDEFVGHAEPLELDLEEEEEEEPTDHQWYILKVQVNREDSIRDALQRRVKMHGLEEHFTEIIVPTEDVVEFTKAGKKRTVKRKLYPGYIMVNMSINDDSWFLVRETPGIGDFTGSAGKPTPMDQKEVDRIIRKPDPDDPEAPSMRIDIPFEREDRVRVKDGNFMNFEGEVESIDAANGRVTVIINIFGRSTPVEFEHWQIEAV